MRDQQQKHWRFSFKNLGNSDAKKKEQWKYTNLNLGMTFLDVSFCRLFNFICEDLHHEQWSPQTRSKTAHLFSEFFVAHVALSCSFYCWYIFLHRILAETVKELTVKRAGLSMCSQFSIVAYSSTVLSKLRIKFAYQAEQAFVTVTVCT